MKNLLNRANDFLQKWDWRDVMLLKLCLYAAGVLVGLAVPSRRKKIAAVLASVLFLATWIPLALRFLPSLRATPVRDIYSTGNAE